MVSSESRPSLESVAALTWQAADFLASRKSALGRGGLVPQCPPQPQNGCWRRANSFPLPRLALPN